MIAIAGLRICSSLVPYYDFTILAFDIIISEIRVPCIYTPTKNPQTPPNTRPPRLPVKVNLPMDQKMLAPTTKEANEAIR